MQPEKRGAVNGAAQVVAGLAQYRDPFTTDRFPAGFRPFGGKAAVAVVGLKTPAENSTPPVPAEILQLMLAAALYVVDTLGPHVVSLTRHIKTERERVNQLPAPHSPGWGVLLQAINRRVTEGRPFNRVPSRIEPITRYAVDKSDPLWGISLRDVAAEAGFSHFRGEWLTVLRPALEQAVAQVGIDEPIGRNATLIARADEQGDLPWTLPLSERHARVLPDVVRTACLLVVAAATGMRSSELFELALGCRLPPERKAPGLVRYRAGWEGHQATAVTAARQTNGSSSARSIGRSRSPSNSWTPTPNLARCCSAARSSRTPTEPSGNG